MTQVKSNLLKIAYVHFNDYSEWLKGQAITQHDMRAQLCRVNHFLVFLGTAFSGDESVFTNGFRRDDALRQYKLYMRQNLKSPVHSVNTTVEAVDRFFRYIGLPPTRVTPDLVENTVRPLSDEQIYRIEMLAQARLNLREQALIWLLLHSGLTTQECSSINLDDVRLSTTSGHVMLGPAEERFKHNLDARCRLIVREYLQERAANYPFPDNEAFFIDERGNRLTAVAVDLVVRQLGREMGIELTGKTIHQTFQYTDAKSQNKALLAAELFSGVVQAG